MDKTTLDRILTTALATSPFTVSGALLQSSGITTLFAGLLGADALVLDGAAQGKPGNPNETVVAGTLGAAFLGQNGLHAEAHFTLVSATAQVIVYLTGFASGWRPSSSFPSIAGGLTDMFAYSNVVLALDSQNGNGLAPGFQTAYGLPANSAGFEATIAKGLSMRATVSFDAGIPMLAHLMPDLSFEATMPVELAGGLPRLLLTISATRPYTIANFAFPIALAYVVSFLEDPDSTTPITTDLVQLNASIERMIGGKNIAIPIAAQFDGASPAQLHFVSDMASSAIAIGEIPALIAGAAIGGQIPPDFPALTDIALLEIDFTIGVGTGSLVLLGISATVGYSDSTMQWKPFGDLIIFHDMSVSFNFNDVPGAGVATYVAAKADIAGGTLDAEAALPAKTFGVKLEPPATLDVVSVLDPIVDCSVTMPEIECATFVVTGDVTAGVYAFHAVVQSKWEFAIGQKPFVLDEIAFDVTRDTAAGATFAEMIGRFTFAGTDLWVGAEYLGAAAAWRFTGGTPDDESIDIKALIADAASLLGLPLPSAVPDITVYNIAMMFETGTHSFFFSCAATMVMLEQTIELGVLVSNVDDAGQSATVFQGTIAIESAMFEIDFTSGAADKRIAATWSGAGGPLDFAGVAQYFHLDISGIPSELIPQVTSASFTYDFTTGTLVFTATTERTQTVFVSTNPAAGAARVYGALIGVDVSVSLSDLPIVGEKLAAIEDVGISGLQLIVTSAPLTADVVTALNALIPDDPAGLPTFPAQALDKGVMLSIPFQFGGNPQPPLAIRFGGANNALALMDPTPAVPSVAWINVQRSFGPVNVQRIGAGYEDGRVVLVIDAGFAMAAVSIELLDLTLGFTLHVPPDITPALHGMSIGYQGGPLQISGGFLDVLRSDGTHEYDGTAAISAAGFTISALGSYATIDGAASLFIFAMLAAPLGGPPFFFVTGIAAGFGVNRSLIIPALDDLPSFPLVAAAMAGETGNNPFAGKSDPASALMVMSSYIPPEYGANWLALGVRFTSFEMIQSFALVTVAFGTRFEVALLGLSAITIPTNAPDPIGYAELALIVSYSPDNGVLAVMGKLMPQSYIFSHDCHLTGGFAFYTWLTDSNPDGAAAGEFVVTLGGYHPSFVAPQYYPQVPRIGANWQVNGNLAVKGGLYFALTPTCVMAGGALEAVWQSGDLKAWFNYQADFLLSWKPFHYSASIGLSLGASYKVNLLFTSFTVAVHLGVWLDIWGPSFAGKARVDLSVVSFTIDFGDSSPRLTPISWADFKQSFLPKPNAQNATSKAPSGRIASVRATTPPAPTDTYCYARVADGLVKDLTTNGGVASGPDWVINPEKFQLVTHSAIPCSRATLRTGNGDPNDPGVKSTQLTGAWTSSGFGVGPVGVANGNLVSHHVITVIKIDASGDPENAYDFSAHATLTPSIGNAPKSAWSAAIALSPDFGAINNSPSTIPSTLNGFTITATPVAPDRTLEIAIATLLATRAPKEPQFAWSQPVIPTTDSFDQQQATATLMSTIAASDPSASRAAIVSALASRGLALDSTIDVTRMAASAANVLVVQPTLRLLGEEESSEC